MINPIGSFLVHTDGALTGVVNGIAGSMTSYMWIPVIAAAGSYYIIQGIRFANGDEGVLHNWVPNLIRVVMVIALSSNLALFQQWVSGVIFGIPGALSTAVGNGTGTPSSLTGTAAAFDNLWAQIWTMVSSLLQQVGWSVNGGVMFVGALFIASFGFMCLFVLVLLYESARMLLAVVVCLMPILIGCAMFDVTKPFFERAVGKIMSLILMQVCGLIILQIVLMSDQWFMAQAVTAEFNQMAAKAQGMSSIAAMGESLEMLVGLVMWFFAGAVAMWNIPFLAYSLGGGIMMRGPPLTRIFGLGSQGGAARPPTITIPLQSPPPVIPYPQQSQGGSAYAALPAPPPPPPLHGP